MARAEVQAAFAHVEASREEILREWVAITEVNAPSGKERERAALVEQILRRQKSVNVRYDAAGNLVAVRKGTGGGPAVVLDAHLDTVFPGGIEDQGGDARRKLYAPGVGDDTRNIEAMLATMRALDAANVSTKGDLVFLFTVEEETTFAASRSTSRRTRRRSATTSRSTAATRASPIAASASTGIGTTSSGRAATRARARRPTRRRSRWPAPSRASTRSPSPTTRPRTSTSAWSAAPMSSTRRPSDAWFTVDLRSTEQRGDRRLREGRSRPSSKRRPSARR